MSEEGGGDHGEDLRMLADPVGQLPSGVLELSPRYCVLAHWLETAPEQEDLGMGTRAVSGDTAVLQLNCKFSPDERDKGLTSQATSLVQKPAYMTVLYIF